jgi:hypothetical protein
MRERHPERALTTPLAAVVKGTRAALVTAALLCGACGSAPQGGPAGVGDDVAVHREIQTLGPESLARVSELAAGIQDPVVREAAVLGWLNTNFLHLSPGQAGALCGLLEPGAQTQCTRQAEAAHLRQGKLP